MSLHICTVSLEQHLFVHSKYRRLGFRPDARFLSHLLRIFEILSRVRNSSLHLLGCPLIALEVTYMGAQ